MVPWHRSNSSVEVKATSQARWWGSCRQDWEVINVHGNVSVSVAAFPKQLRIYCWPRQYGSNRRNLTVTGTGARV